MNRISIDFGTSNTQIACLDANGHPKNIGDIIPTVLYVDKASGSILVGLAAVHAYEAALSAGNTDAGSYYLETFKPDICLARIQPRERTVLTGVDGNLMSWLDVLAHCFSHLREYAKEKEFAGEEVDSVVLTHPVNFPNKELYHQAALKAGFKEVLFVQEPEAAYLGYKADGRNLGNNVLVFDMGGGTLDVALLENAGGNWIVRTSPLRLDIAGHHIDLAICESLRDELREAGILSPQGDIEAPFIKYAREQIKEQLGSGTLNSVRIRYMSDVSDAVLKENYALPRFHQVLDGLMDGVYRRISDYVKGLPTQPDTILMVGGSSRLKYVKDKLAALFSDIKVFAPADGGSLVAKGAMLYSHAENGIENGEEKGKEALDDDDVRTPSPSNISPDSAVATLVQLGISQDKYDDELLKWAGEGRCYVVRLLISAGVDVNKADNDRPDRGFFARLRMGFLNLFTGNYGGYTPLCRAAANGHEECVKLLLGSSDIKVNHKDRRGYSPLHLAARNGHAGCVELIALADGCDVNMTDSFGWTALLHAAEGGTEKCVDALLKQPGINIESVTPHGQTVLHLAANRDRASMVERLLRLPGLRVNAKDADGRTALHLAAKAAASDVVEKLLNSPGIVVSGKSSLGETALFLAAEKGDAKSVELLLKAEPECINLSSNDGYTPLLVALKNESFETAGVLLDAPELDLNIADDNGNTPLIYAVRRGNLPLVKKMLATKDLDVNRKNKAGETALYSAIQDDRMEIFNCLLNDSRTDVNAKVEDRTPLLMAITYYGRTSYVKALLEHRNIEVDCKDSVGRSPIDLATEMNRTECVEILRQHGIS